MIRFATLAPVLAILASPVAAQPTQVSLEHRMLLRCSAAFALGARLQAEGDPAALAFPPLAQRGGEFFVRASARVMDEAGLDRAAIAEALRREAQVLVEAGTLGEIMPPCLDMLEAAGI